VNPAETGAADAPVIAVEELSVRYGRTMALESVSFSVPRGAIMALLGRNGAGKSSLVRCLLGQQKPTRGRLCLFGADVWTTRRRAMERVGVVPEEPDAPPEMTARELGAFCRRLYPRWDDSGFDARLKRFAVPQNLPFARLSKGQKGAVMLALCLAPSPEVLVLDDPTLGLDAFARRALYDELISDLADRGITVLVTTHDLVGIEGLASRVAVLRNSRLILDEEQETLKSRFRRIRCAAAADWAPFEAVTVRHRDWGDEAVVANFDEARLEAFRARGRSSDIEVGSLSLEEIFLSVAGEREAS
jgi:ABC-2 type transport system ATP-binding protein